MSSETSPSTLLGPEVSVAMQPFFRGPEPVALGAGPVLPPVC